MKPLPFAPDSFPAIIVPILARTGEDAARQAIVASSQDGVDVLEWRIDPLVAGSSVGMRDTAGEDGVGEDSAAGVGGTAAGVRGTAGGRAGVDSEVPDADLARHFDAFVRSRVATLVTVRSEAEGGFCPVEHYAAAVRAAITLCPDAVDIEVGRDESAALIAAARDAGVSAVVSAHSWESTPTGEQLDAEFADMVTAGADVAKIAVMPQSIDDVLTLLGATWRASQKHDIPIIGIAMGELGRVTRICGGEFGSAATFATVGAGSAPGQMTAEQVDLIRSILLRN